MTRWQIDSSWTLFLDRDGVINKRKMGGYIQKIEEFEFLDRVPETIAQLSPMFAHLFIVTNQQGIGKKLMTEHDLLSVHDYMLKQLQVHGGRISACYHAPNLASENSLLRKPNIGMGLLAKKNFPEIEFTKSIMVGDSDTDIEFGHNLGMKTVRILSDQSPKIIADKTIHALCELPNLFLPLSV